MLPLSGIAIKHEDLAQALVVEREYILYYILYIYALCHIQYRKLKQSLNKACKKVIVVKCLLSILQEGMGAYYLKPPSLSNWLRNTEHCYSYSSSSVR